MGIPVKLSIDEKPEYLSLHQHFRLQTNHMTGREDAVIERFRKQLRQACERASKVDMNAPLSGADRRVNADEFFGIGGHFFLVEFKSSQRNLKDESRKPSACTLCCRLNESKDARALHDEGHFAAWGRKEYNGTLQTKIGVYRKLVCRTDVLPDCKHAVTPPDDWEAISGEDFLARAEHSDLGLDADNFKAYLKWLLDLPPENGSPPEFPLVLFGYTYSDGVQDTRFASYADFSRWATAAVKYAKTIRATKTFRP